MRTAAEIEHLWHQMMAPTTNRNLWVKASVCMDKHMADGMDEDRAAEQAMIDVGWISAVMSSMGEQAAEEYEEAISAQELMQGD